MLVLLLLLLPPLPHLMRLLPLVLHSTFLAAPLHCCCLRRLLRLR